MQYLWFLTRDNQIDETLYAKMMGIAQAALPNFDFTKLAKRDYQGDKCKYETPTLANYFLQWENLEGCLK